MLKTSPARSRRGATSRDRLKTLMVQVRNLQGRIVWTFPKGHIEKGESSAQAALREVKEETGWACKISGRRNIPFEKVRYFFKRGSRTVCKQVTWFLMRPDSRDGSRDPQEIIRVRWCSLSEAKRKAVYPSDKRLLDHARSRFLE